MGLIMLGGVFFAMGLSSMPAYSGMLGPNATVVIMVYVIIVAAVNFYPIFALLKYSSGMRSALTTLDKNKFNEALAYLKNTFKYIGILTIIVLCIYGLVIILAIITALGR
jgi:hypothetical protein